MVGRMGFYTWHAEAILHSPPRRDQLWGSLASSIQWISGDEYPRIKRAKRYT